MKNILLIQLYPSGELAWKITECRIFKTIAIPLAI
jgi:hypothetical protein